MKAVVAEVLNGKKPNTQQKRDTSSPHSASSKSNDPDALQQLIRPNYQNRNIEKRLSMLGHSPKQEKKDEPTAKAQTTKVTNQPKSLLEDPISQLKKVSLSNRTAEPVTTRIPSPARVENAKLIGTTKDGTSIWFFPSVHPNLSQMFQRATTGYSVAVVNSKSCYPSQLLLLNEWLNVYPDLKYHLTWNRANSQPLTLELYDSNHQRLEEVAKEMYLRFSKRSEVKVETYHLISPSAWISKQLGMTKSVESVGILEGLSYFNNLLVLDHFYKSEHLPPLSIQLEQNYLIATGKPTIITETLATLKKLAEQI
jgi:hypothetical protein